MSFEGISKLIYGKVTPIRPKPDKFPFPVQQENLRKRLSQVQYDVTQRAGTERPFTGKFTEQREGGTYSCVVCQKELFSSECKYPCSCGWASFYDVVSIDRISYSADYSHGPRVEVCCAECGSHLGHVFEDGPPPTSLRYCINSASLHFTRD